MTNDHSVAIGILSRVVTRFVNDKAATPRRTIIKEFRDSAVLNDLVNRSFLRRRDGVTIEEFLPTAGAFQFCNDPSIRRSAKTGLTLVLHALRHMYLGTETDTGYVFNDIKQAVNELFPDRIVDDDTLKLGLYLAQDFGILGGSRNPSGAEVELFQISENAATTKDLDGQWDIQMTRYRLDDQLEARESTISSQLVARDDSRLTVAATLWDASVPGGKFLGNAAILSQDIAVTAAEIFQHPGATSISRLVLSFPGLMPAPGVYPVEARVEAVDGNRRFAKLTISGSLPQPLPANLVNGGFSPEWSDCEVVFYDDDKRGMYRISLPQPKIDGLDVWFWLGNRTHAVAALKGAPVFRQGRVVGIVVRTQSDSESMQVLTVDGMALSTVTHAVRRLLEQQGVAVHPEEARSATLELRSVPDSMPLDAAYQRVREWYQKNVNRVSEFHLDRDLTSQVKTVVSNLPESLNRVEMRAVLNAVVEGVLEWGAAESDGELTMRDYARAGMKSSGGERFGEDERIVLKQTSGMARSLWMGYRKGEDDSVARPFEADETERESNIASSIARPTPRVDPDLWCSTDQLGYEAYARTIASLITHPETKPPLTIGIKAPWGAGKTSLMKRVQHLLDGNAKLSEENRSGILQQGQPSQMTLKELLEALRGNTSPERLRFERSKEGEAYGLEPRNTVWFNAWKYQTSEQIWAGMAHCIISQVTARMGVKERELFWLRLHARRVNADEVRWKVYTGIVRQLLPVALFTIAGCAMVMWLAAVIPILFPFHHLIQAVSVLVSILGMTRKWFNKLGDKAAGTVRDLIREPDYEGKLGYLHLVESDIREVLKLATAPSVTRENPNGYPLIVFVDDLDRCAPNRVAEVVEAINLFLAGDYPNCIFVLGMEPGMVAAALEVAYKDVILKAQEMGLGDKTVPIGWRFMEKIIQLPITIPPPTQVALNGYIKFLTGFPGADEISALALAGQVSIGGDVTTVLSKAQEREEKIRGYVERFETPLNVDEAVRRSDDLLAEVSGEERWAAAEASKRVYERTFNDRDPVIAKFVGEVAHLVGRNPRQIKRYVNVFRFYSTLRHALRVDSALTIDLPADDVLAKFVALSIQWPHALDCLRLVKEIYANGVAAERKSLLTLLEEESRIGLGDDIAGDESWAKFCSATSLELGQWAKSRAFRQFLSRGAKIGHVDGHGLW